MQRSYINGNWKLILTIILAANFFQCLFEIFVHFQILILEQAKQSFYFFLPERHLNHWKHVFFCSENFTVRYANLLPPTHRNSSQATDSLNTVWFSHNTWIFYCPACGKKVLIFRKNVFEAFWQGLEELGHGIFSSTSREAHLEHWPFKEKLRNLFFIYVSIYLFILFKLGKRCFWVAICNCLPEEMETGSFWRCMAVRRKASDWKMNMGCSNLTRGKMFSP